MFTECIRGKGLKEIARGINCDGLTAGTGRKWGATSLHHVLRNEPYIGLLIWDRRKKRKLGANATIPVRVEGAWPAIIDRDMFSQVQACLAARASKFTHPKWCTVNILSAD